MKTNLINRRDENETTCLVITRREGEEIVIQAADGSETIIAIRKTANARFKVAIRGPKKNNIMRGEVYLKDQEKLSMEENL